MIVSCPECGARYRLADDAIPADGRAMRCASCSHRWFEAGPDLPPDEHPAQPEASAAHRIRARVAQAPEPPLPETAPPPPEPPPAPPRTLLKTLFALALSAALTTGAVLVQAPNLPPLDLSRVPWLARLLDPPRAPPSPLRTVFTVDRQPVAGGRTLFALTGTLSNPSPANQRVPPLEGRLVDTAGAIAYRWRIVAPAAQLPPGGAVPFDASAIGDGSDRVVVALLPD